MGTARRPGRGQALSITLRGPGWGGIWVLRVGCLGQILLFMAEIKGS